MSATLIKVRPENCDYPSQPRSNPDPEYCRSLGESMKAIGQQVPIIGYTEFATERFNVSDGGCRLQGARLCGIPELLAMDLGKKPTQIELLRAQAEIDNYKQHLKALDRARLAEFKTLLEDSRAPQCAAAHNDTASKQCVQQGSTASKDDLIRELSGALEELVKATPLFLTSGSTYRRALARAEEAIEMTKEQGRDI
jgi:ParB-like nuclease family protein